MSARRPRRVRGGAPIPKAAPAAAARPMSLPWIALGLLTAVIAAGAALRVWLSFNDDGIFWPDEIYQSLEPAHHWVFGTAIMPWEFLNGARNWAFPATIAVFLKLSSFVSSDPRVYLDLTRLAFSAASVAAAL